MYIKKRYLSSSPQLRGGVRPAGGRRGCQMKRTFLVTLLFVFLLLPQLTEAQCAMCRAVLESEGNVSSAEGINNGIVYLMAIPYILIAGLFFFIYKKMKA